MPLNKESLENLNLEDNEDLEGLVEIENCEGLAPGSRLVNVTKFSRGSTILEQPIYKANEFIRKSKFDLSKTEMRIVNFMLACINQRNSPFDTIQFYTYDFCKACGITNTNTTYIRDVIKKLADKSVAVKTKISDADGNEKEYYVPIRWIDDWKINVDDSTIELKFHERLSPYFLKLEGMYTKTQLSAYILFQCKYSAPIYDMCKSYANIAFKNKKSEVAFRWDVEDFRERLCIVDKFEKFSDIKKRIITPAIEEINMFTELDISVDVERYRNVATSLLITVKYKNAIDHMRLTAKIEHAAKDMGLTSFAKSNKKVVVKSVNLPNEPIEGQISIEFDDPLEVQAEDIIEIFDEDFIVDDEYEDETEDK